jgi:anti-sigma factor RsiW
MDPDHRLIAYVDGQLEPEEMLAVEELLATDAAARQQVRVYRETATLLRAACADAVYERPPLQIEWTPRPTARAWHWSMLRRAAVWLLIVAAGFAAGQVVSMPQTSAHAQLMDEVSDYHRFFAAADRRHLAEIPPERTDEFIAWLNAVGLDARPADLAPLGYAFAGGRMYVVDEQPIGEFFFVRPGEAPVGICITKRNGEGKALQFDERDGMILASWGAGDYTYVVVGTPDRSETQAIVDRLTAGSRA